MSDNYKKGLMTLAVVVVFVFLSTKTDGDMRIAHLSAACAFTLWAFFTLLKDTDEEEK